WPKSGAQILFAVRNSYARLCAHGDRPLHSTETRNDHETHLIRLAVFESDRSAQERDNDLAEYTKHRRIEKGQNTLQADLLTIKLVVRSLRRLSDCARNKLLKEDTGMCRRARSEEVSAMAGYVFVSLLKLVPARRRSSFASRTYVRTPF